MARKRIDWKAQPLGKVPDPVIAAQLGVSYHTVATARWRLGIPSHRAQIVRHPIRFPIEAYPALRNLAARESARAWRLRNGRWRSMVEPADTIQHCLMHLWEVCQRGVAEPPHRFMPWARIVMRNALKQFWLRYKKPDEEAPAYEEPDDDPV